MNTNLKVFVFSLYRLKWVFKNKKYIMRNLDLFWDTWFILAKSFFIPDLIDNIIVVVALYACTKEILH